MATAAFKSTTKRTPMGTSSTASSGDSSSSNRTSSVQRRARSLSRFSRRLPAEDACNDINEMSAPRRRFVNTVRGSGFPEISLDDLAIEFFESANRGRLTSRLSESRPKSGTSASQRRGRSVSRKSSGAGDSERGSVRSSSRGGRAVSDANPRRRRSVSVVRYQISDSESDLDHSKNFRSHTNLKNTDTGNKQMPVAPYQRPALRRSRSRKDMRLYDGYSSQSSVLTDDEGTGVCFNKNGIETIRAAYAQNKAMPPGMNKLHKATWKDLRNGPDNIKIKIEQHGIKPKNSTLPTVHCLLTDNSDVQSVSVVRRNYKSELVQSEKREKGLPDEQCGREISKVVKKMLPDTNNNAIGKPSRARKRSNDKSRISKHWTEEAERIIEDFISSVEDTDFSSFDGERSDASSSIGGSLKPEPLRSLPIVRSPPVAMDGVSLPWLQWETNNDASGICLNKTQMQVTPISANSIQEITASQDQCDHSTSNCGSWSPDNLPVYIGKDLSSKFEKSCNCQNQSLQAESKGLRYDMDEYLKVKRNEDLLIERWKQQRIIKSGSLLLCAPRLF